MRLTLSTPVDRGAWTRAPLYLPVRNTSICSFPKIDQGLRSVVQRFIAEHRAMNRATGNGGSASGTSSAETRSEPKADDGGVAACGRPAAFAQMSQLTYFLCAPHAADVRRTHVKL